MRKAKWLRNQTPTQIILEVCGIEAIFVVHFNDAKMKMLATILCTLVLALSGTNLHAQGNITFDYGYDENFCPYVYGKIENNSNATVTSVEITMYYRGLMTEGGYKSQKVVKVNVPPGKTMSYSVTFPKDVQGKKPVSFVVNRLRLSDGTIKQLGSEVYLKD